MITVSEFVRQSSVWRQVAPTLEQFVRWSNTNVTSFSQPLSMSSQGERNALIAEVAFRLAEAGFVQGSAPPVDLETHARELISRLPRGRASADQLMSFEWSYAYQICATIQAYADDSGPVVYSPRAPGCGVVGASFADIIRGSELIEVNAVKRPFRTADFRQVLTYAAMLYASDCVVTHISLLNPRLCEVVAVSLDNVATGVCGQSRVELMQDLVNFMVGLQVSA
jgi:hypothetical protein